MAGDRVVFFLFGGVSFFHLVREQDRKEKQQLSNFKQPSDLKTSWADPWKLKSPFNNTLPFVPTFPSSTTFTGCANQTASFFFFPAHIHGISVKNNGGGLNASCCWGLASREHHRPAVPLFAPPGLRSCWWKMVIWWLVALDMLMSFGWHVWEEPKPLKGPSFKRHFFSYLPTGAGFLFPKARSFFLWLVGECGIKVYFHSIWRFYAKKATGMI